LIFVGPDEIQSQITTIYEKVDKINDDSNKYLILSYFMQQRLSLFNFDVALEAIEMLVKLTNNNKDEDKA
jgi:hypothetical protein